MMQKTQQILIIGSVWPEPNSSAAGSRMMQLIEAFQQQKWQITFCSAASESDFMFDWKSLGITKTNIELNNSSFDSFVEQLQPSMVVFDRFMTEEQFGWRVAEKCPNALRILDTIDLHCLRVGRQTAFYENRKFSNEDLLLSSVAKREVASIFRCDVSLLISEIEMDILVNFFKIPNSLLYYLPFMLNEIDCKELEIWPSFQDRNNFISIGTFLHEPNWNAVCYLKELIWPLIRKKLPQAEIHIYGAYASQKVTEMHQPKTGFCIMGRAEDAKNVVRQARLCLAPLQFGAGLKGKLVEAMQCGTPSVTTDIGAEAMHGKLEWSGIIANGAEEIAAAAVELYTNEVMWQQAQKNGIEIINTVYSKKTLSQKFIERLLDVQNNLEKHRSANFMGAMLMHHTAASTKYMSRWIEIKNKRSIAT